MALRVLVTRAADQAADWVDSLRGRGIEAVALPLLAIEAPSDTGACHQAWHGLAEHAIVMFVSPNAVTRFFAAGGPGAAWPAGLRAAAPGPGTAKALVAHGVPPEAVVEPPPGSAAFDSEHLWPLLQDEDWHGASVLIVRGDGGRDWLAERWRDAGARVSNLEVYRRVEPRWTPQELALLADAGASPRQHVWLFSSSQAVQTLVSRARPSPGSRALATHPSIVRTAREAGFTEVRQAQPDLDSVVHCLESWA